MKKIEYTEQYHAEALLEILEGQHICSLCPRDDGHNSDFFKYMIRSSAKNFGVFNFGQFKANCCKVCRNFVDMPDSSRVCPCHYFIQPEAIKRTWIALEEKGYI